MRKGNRILLTISSFILALAVPLTSLSQTWQVQQKVIPVAVENTACNPAAETFGLSAAPATLLVCQSGKWVQQSGSSVITPLYLRNGGALPAACPATWTQIDVGFISEGSSGGGNYVRSCMPPKQKTCSTMYFKNAAAAPAACPAPWAQSDLGFVFESNTVGNYVRSCFRCD
jgi:hypothetical protein